MRLGYFSVLIASLVFLPGVAFGGEEAGETVEESADETTAEPEKELTLEEKVAKAHELVSTHDYKSKQELLRLIHEVGVENFLKPVMDDEEQLMTVIISVMRGSVAGRGALTRADLATYLLKDKRPAIRDEALERVAQYAMCVDKPLVSDLLFGMYQEAKDDAELRLKFVEAFVRAGSPNPPYPEPEERPKLDYNKTLKRFPTLFRDPDPRVRRVAVESLNTDSLTVEKSGVNVLQKDPDNHVRAAVIDYYRRGTVKSGDVVAMVLKSLDTGNVDELESAVRYCKAMRINKSREPMFAMTRRFADYARPGARALRVRLIKSLVVDTAMELEWKEAVPELIWMAQNDVDTRAKVYAAYGALTVSGSDTVRLGTTEVVFPERTVEAETAPLLKAFDAWVIRVHEGKGDTPEVKRLEEEAQIEFTEKIYEIAKQRLADRDLKTKKRGLDLVMEIGPEEFAKEYDAVDEMLGLVGSLLVFRDYQEEVKANRQFARLMLAFARKDDVKMKKLALEALGILAGHCDREVFIPVLWEMRNHPDKEVKEMVNRAGKAISDHGYLGSEERKKQGEAGTEESSSKPDQQ